MVLLQSLAISSILLLAHSFIRKHSSLCYAFATFISFSVILLVLNEAVPSTKWIFPVFTQGGLAGSLFLFVMFAGAFPNGSRFIRLVMPIRGELSIIASILTLGHNIAYGKTYFVRLFTGSKMPVNILLAAICSLLMLIIMLPLFITSFRFVRRRMKPVIWKRLQRTAYVFYSLMFVHVLLLNYPGAKNNIPSAINVLIYGMLFLTYGYMRIRKALLKRTLVLPAKLLLVPATGVIFVLFFPIFSKAEYYSAGLQDNKSDVISLSETVSEAATSPVLSTEEPLVLNIYEDGTFTGSGMGFNGYTEVELTIESGLITNIVILSAEDDDPYFSMASEAILPAVIAAQSAEVDAVSGATYSSGGIRTAIANALKSAEHTAQN